MKKCEHLEPRGQRHTWPDRSPWLSSDQQNFSRLHWNTESQTGGPIRLRLDSCRLINDSTCKFLPGLWLWVSSAVDRVQEVDWTRPSSERGRGLTQSSLKHQPDGSKRKCYYITDAATDRKVSVCWFWVFVLVLSLYIKINLSLVYRSISNVYLITFVVLISFMVSSQHASVLPAADGLQVWSWADCSRLSGDRRRPSAAQTRPASSVNQSINQSINRSSVNHSISCSSTGSSLLRLWG